VNLQDAANRLGVHYQTAYRWVREGALVAAKVSSVYEVEDSEVERFLQLRLVPAAPPDRIQVRNWETHQQNLVEFLVRGNELEARLLVDRLAEGKVSSIDICERLLGPALRSVGQLWHDGALSIGGEHRATSIVERVIGRLTTHPRGRPRGTAIVATLTGEAHGMPAAMAALVLRDDRWRVHHLGSDLPIIEIVKMVHEVDANIVVVSITYASDDQVEQLRGLLPPSAHLLIGAPGKSLTELVLLARKYSLSALSE
jgi:MerR family transcriptional regulator, light-induced transcriptional regulator